MASSSRRRNYMLSNHRRDELIAMMKTMLHHSFVLDVMKTTVAGTFEHFEELIHEHYENPDKSRLKVMVPSLGRFFHPLRLRKAFVEYDTKYCITARRFVSPTFNELRHILNLATVHALAPAGAGADGSLKMITFDGDETLYRHGDNFASGSKLARYIIKLMQNGVHVALVTAAGYPHDGAKYEGRMRGLLDSFVASSLPEEVMARFWVLGGECNYLFRCGANARLTEVPSREWLPEAEHWSAEEIRSLLDTAESCIRSTMASLKLRGRVLRKERAVGLIPGGKEGKKREPTGSGGKSIRRELLDEVCLAVQEELRAASFTIPYCAFNGGGDVFVDIGNKRVGVQGMQSYLKLRPEQCLHVGDQFLNTGNDFSCRDACATVWITSPVETKYILKRIVTALGLSAKNEVGAEAGGGGGGAAAADDEPQRKKQRQGAAAEK